MNDNLNKDFNWATIYNLTTGYMPGNRNEATVRGLYPSQTPTNHNAGD